MTDDQEKVAESEVMDFVNQLNHLGDQFDKLCVDRYLEGQEKYGQFAFLGNDVIEVMLDELADISNYCRMQAVKLMLLQNHLDLVINEKLTPDEEGDITIGVRAFKGVKDVGWIKK